MRALVFSFASRQPRGLDRDGLLDRLVQCGVLRHDQVAALNCSYRAADASVRFGTDCGNSIIGKPAR
jgi:hypothetical protein